MWVTFVLSLGHENMYYLELDNRGTVTFFNHNGQCAAGSGSFWYQQATRMGYNDRELAEVAVDAGSSVKISGRCAVFAKV
jgi:activator of 2-hydroxyglutaryl-CoA dehydratase